MISDLLSIVFLEYAPHRSTSMINLPSIHHQLVKLHTYFRYLSISILISHVFTDLHWRFVIFHSLPQVTHQSSSSQLPGAVPTGLLPVAKLTIQWRELWVSIFPSFFLGNHGEPKSYELSFLSHMIANADTNYIYIHLEMLFVGCWDSWCWYSQHHCSDEFSTV